jgi:hypothetical protein
MAPLRGCGIGTGLIPGEISRKSASAGAEKDMM